MLVDVPMDSFSRSADRRLPAGAAARSRGRRSTRPLPSASPQSSPSAAAGASTPAAACISARATAELAALAEALEIPVAHSLMGKGCLREDHPLLLGMTGFWGTPIANDNCRQADVMLAVGTRLAEASSSSWDPRFTFAAPPTRVIHIDADLAEIGRNLPTELGVVADAKLALAALARPRRRADSTAIAGRCASDIARRPARVRGEVGASVDVRSVSAAARADSQRAAEGRSRGRLHRHRRRLEQERRRAAVLDHRARHVHHAERTGDDGLRRRRRCWA